MVNALEFADIRIPIPFLAVDLISADVEVVVWEKTGHFSNERVKELVGSIAGGIKGGIKHSPIPFDLEGPGSAGKFRIGSEKGRCVSGDVELRNNANAAIARIRNHFTDFFLRVIQTVGTQLLQLGEFFAFHAEALIVRQVPVQDVQLNRLHAIEISFD